MAWTKGESGNPNGRPTVNKPFYEALNRAIKADDGKKLRAIAEKLLEAAAAGEPWAVKELVDRTDGKAVQAIDATVDANLTVQVVRFADPPA